MSTDDCPKRPVIIDGAISSVLHSFGYEYGSSLEEWIFNYTDKFTSLLREYIDAGSEIVTTPTSTANSLMLKQHGLDDQCEKINERLAALTRKTVDETGKKVKIGFSVGPTGTLVQPYTETSFTELLSAYSRQIQNVCEYVDFFMIESMLSMSDMRAAALTCKRTGKPLFVTVSIDEDGNTIVNGVPALSALITLQEIGVDAFGISCSSVSDTIVNLKKLAPYAKIPLIAKPYRSEQFSDEELSDLLSCGADYVGLCCGSSPSDIKQLTEISKQITYDNLQVCEKEDVSFIFCFEKQVFFLEPDTTEISEPVECLPDMEETIAEICEQPIDILRVEINTADDAIDFARNAHMSTLPVMFLSHDELALKMALLYYQGRALIDSTTSIPEENLEIICNKYGSVVY